MSPKPLPPELHAIARAVLENDRVAAYAMFDFLSESNIPAELDQWRSDRLWLRFLSQGYFVRPILQAFERLGITSMGRLSETTMEALYNQRGMGLHRLAEVMHALDRHGLTLPPGNLSPVVVAGIAEVMKQHKAQDDGPPQR